jgi:hypothetical protein
MRVLNLPMWLTMTALLSCLAGSAGADAFYPEFLRISAEGMTSEIVLSSDDLGCIPQGGGILSCDGSGQSLVIDSLGFDVEIFDWSLEVNEDPYVSQAFGFKNNSATTETFVIINSIPILPVGPTSVMGGSAGGSVTDSNFDGLGGVNTLPGTPLYIALIDGAPVPSTALHADPFSQGFLFPGHTANIQDTLFGLPGPTLAGPAASTSIGIRSEFQLSGGDSIAMTNFFVIESVPEPGTASLLGLGLAGLGLLGRRPTPRS